MAKLGTATKALVEFRGVSKYSGSGADIRDLSFIFPQGLSYGILGDHKSGIKNLLKLIYCATFPDKGDVEVCGLDTRHQATKIKGLLGIVPRFDMLEPDLSVHEQLRIFGKFFDLSQPQLKSRIRDLVQQLELAECETQLIRNLSRFQRKKVALAQALIHNPKILVLDELGLGLGNSEKYWLYEQVLAIHGTGCDLIVGSSDPIEIEKLCKHAIVIHRGSLVAEGPPAQMIDKIVGHYVVDFECPSSEMEYYFSKLNNNYEVYMAGQRVRVYLKVHQELRDLMAQISSPHLLTRRTNLEDVYFKTTGQILEKSWDLKAN